VRPTGKTLICRTTSNLLPGSTSDGMSGFPSGESSAGPSALDPFALEQFAVEQLVMPCRKAVAPRVGPAPVE
jgi:hypothetical protein